MFQSTTGDRIIGSTEAKRSTKTMISSERSAMVLAMIENHAVSHVETTQQLRYHEDVRAALAALPADALPEERASAIAGVKELTLDEVVEEYAGARKWVKLHQQLVEHFASVDGFSTQAVVSMAKAQLQGQHLPESSIKAV